MAHNVRQYGRWFALLVAAVLATTGHASPSAREGRTTDYLTVCGDANNLPYSNEQMEGFENRIAVLVAEKLDRPLQYRWWPQTIGFIRNTLKTRLCDLIMGVTSANELVQNSNPYYRSVYTLVQRNDGTPPITDLDDNRLQSMKIGVIAGTPPATLLARLGLMSRVQPYHRTVDTRHFSPAVRAIQDVANGTTDIALVWGPIAGYAAHREEPPLRVTPLPANVDGSQMAFSVSMGMRHRETQWKHEINAVIDELEPQFQQILLEYHVPLLDNDDRPIEQAAPTVSQQ